MSKLIAYPLSVLYYLCFGMVLVIFHVLQWICLNVFGLKAHKISVDWLQFFLMRCLNILGARFTFVNAYDIPKNKPLIIVTNHQSMYDIPPIIWYMRKHHPKFVSKKELGKGIPSVSYNLRHGGSVLIDRKDPKGSIKAIEAFANKIKNNNWSAVIFPEGTRSKTGDPKPFKTNGLLSLMQNIPNGLVVPITINNSWKILRYGKFPLALGSKVQFIVHEPLPISEYEPKVLIKIIETQIKGAIL